ncbi:BTB domain-containing protein [Acanthamoeba polyphaga mimivirus]|uniref:BTB domain-containing protein n=1 Tax=Acanthamoeba polyphaga mimivirus Kroon TaxID=3069720 RepID=A0A0G2Y268_9VIRU|nr:BTB domain-containing protein [Acanthamoeba polyphaga mimivirus]AKI79835.1 BTB domain-containing protein [Acanthamoeba polyphaga mimivirus Kroon]
MELSLSTLFNSEIFSDLTIEFIDNHNKTKIHVHKNILYLGCSYFRSMFNGFSELNSREIIIRVPDVNASIDVIKYFYGIEITNNNNWKYDLNIYACKKFFGLETEFPVNIIVVPSEIEDFLDFIDKIGYDDNTLKLIAKNLPESYNLQKFPKNFIKALFEILDTKYLILVFSHEIILVDINGTTYKSIKTDFCIKGICHIQNTTKIAYCTNNIIRVYDFEENKIVFEKNSYTHRICSANGKLFASEYNIVREINLNNCKSYRFFRSEYDEKIILELFYDNEFIIVFGQPHVHSSRIKTLICFYNMQTNDKIRSFYYDGNIDMLEYCPVNKCMLFCENSEKTGKIYRVYFYDDNIKIFTKKELVYKSKCSKIIKIIWVPIEYSLIFCCESGTIGVYYTMTNETKILMNINDKIKDATLIKNNILAILSNNTVYILDINKCDDNISVNKINLRTDIVKIMSTSSINIKLANKISELLDNIDDNSDDDSDNSDSDNSDSDKVNDIIINKK